MKRMLNAAVIAGAPVAPASASANYMINHRQARAYLLNADEKHHYGNGVGATSAMCKPKFIGADNWLPYERFDCWVCSWDGDDEDDYEAYGHFRIIGQSGNTSGNLALYGGLRGM